MEDEGPEQPQFTEQLRERAINSGTPHCDVNSLLTLLKLHRQISPFFQKTAILRII